MFCIFWYESSKEKIAILTFSVVYTCTKREQLCNWKDSNYEISLAHYSMYTTFPRLIGRPVLINSESHIDSDSIP